VESELAEDRILEARNLTLYYYVKGRKLRALDNVSFELKRGETLGIAGESGSGKSTLALSMLRLLPDNAEFDESSQIIYYGEEGPVDVLSLKERELYNFRWRNIAIVFQGALNSLNPTIRVGDHFLDTAKAHGMKDEQEILEKSKKLLEMVRLEPRRVLRSYPHELSGGMKQRVLIALSLLLDPKVLILDEPTTALDVITQKYVLDIIRDIKRRLDLSVILITHDLGLIAYMTNRVIILYTGEIVEEGSLEDVFYSAAHPYTVGLMKSLPTLDIREFKGLVTIPGSMPTLGNVPPGCPFHPRCPIMQVGICDKEKPELKAAGPDHRVACHFYSKARELGAKIYG
jgi:oligopeptide/dipeptide ABC transporter, ATP-binding protein, C-terminal domain